MNTAVPQAPSVPSVYKDYRINRPQNPFRSGVIPPVPEELEMNFTGGLDMEYSHTIFNNITMEYS